MDGAVTSIELVRTGEDVPLGLLDELAAGLARTLRTSIHVRTEPIDAKFAYDEMRGQMYATAVLKSLAGFEPRSGLRRLVVTTGDLFVPVLTFVFGEAQLGGSSAIVSLCRLDEAFYGLPRRQKLLAERLLTEALHELGHTFGLRHCDDWECVMASSHSVERIDLKHSYCDDCRAEVRRVVG